MDTDRTIHEIEAALAESEMFNFLNKRVNFNVRGESRFLPIHHECDMLVLTTSNYLWEIEIKRSWQDFVADFKKKHHHRSKGRNLIKRFFYCVPVKLLPKVVKALTKNNIDYSGIVTYSEALQIKVWGNMEKTMERLEMTELPDDEWYDRLPTLSDIKDFDAVKLTGRGVTEYMRYGAMRAVVMRKKVGKLQRKVIDLEKQIERLKKKLSKVTTTEEDTENLPIGPQEPETQENQDVLEEIRIETDSVEVDE